MPLLEIVRTNHTSPQVIVDLLDIGKKIRKTLVVVGNCTGFVVNIMFFPYTQAAILHFEHRTDPYMIDRAITKFRMPMGSFRGGIMFWGHSLGSKYIYSRLEEWTKMFGEFFKLCSFLTERAAKGAPLKLVRLQDRHSSNWSLITELTTF